MFCVSVVLVVGVVRLLVWVMLVDSMVRVVVSRGCLIFIMGVILGIGVF